MLKAIILDMDGLLIDSEPLWRRVEVSVFNELGVPLTEERCLETTGLRSDEVVEYWFSRYPWQAAPISEVAARLVREVIKLIQEEGRSKEGVENLFQILKNLNYKIAVASSSPTDLINVVVSKLGLAAALSAVHSAEHELYGKPHPGVYITAAEKLGVRPEECLAFEDSVNGIIAAKAARMRCIAAPDPPSRSRREFCLADLTLDSLEQVTEQMIQDLSR